MRKKIYIFILLVIITSLAYFLYISSLHESVYLGLPTVPCFDTTLPIKQDYSLSIEIFVTGKRFPLNSSIGHDYGNCLHTIFVNDTSGRVFIKANDKHTYTLGQFFDVWHSTFNNYQMGIYRAKTKIKVVVNGKESTVQNIRDIPLVPNSTVAIFYD